MQIELPEMLNVPPKLLPILLNFDKYNYHFAEGGMPVENRTHLQDFFYISAIKEKLEFVVVVRHKNQLKNLLRLYLMTLLKNTI